MPKDDTAVANPPKGGDQSQASTNDDNINDALQRPYVVVVAAHGQAGVHSRFASRGEAEAAAAAARANRPDFVEVSVVKENDPKDGLPALVTRVEAAELARSSK